MPTTAFESTSPYDVLSPIPDSTDSDSSVDVDVDASTDTSVDDQPEVDAGVDEGQEQDQDQDSADASEEDDSSAEGGDQEADQQAAKAEDVQWKAKDGNIPSALKDLINANPQHAKKLKEMYFNNQRFQKFGPTTEIQKMKEAVASVGGAEKLVELKNQIDLLGGEAGFQEAVQELETWRGVDQQWMNSDPAFVDHLAKVNPASFEALAPVFFGKLGDINPELYNNIGAKLISMTLAQDGTYMNLQFLQQALAAGQSSTAAGYLEKIMKRVDGLNQMATQAPQRKAQNPQESEWKQKEQKYEEQISQTFQTELIAANQGWMNPKVTNELGTYLNGAEKKLSPATLSRIDQAVKQEIWDNHLANNPAFVKQREALMGKRDKDALVRLYKQYAGDKLWQKVTRDICAEFSLKPNGKKTLVKTSTQQAQGAQPQQKAEQGFQKVTGKLPNPEEVDNSKTTYDMKVKNQFVMKDGRKLQYVK